MPFNILKMTQRLLNKTRYKLALECPNKLFYTNKEAYANKKSEDSFLESLADGGFQVEELARLEFPDGVLVEGDPGDYDALVAETKKLLKQENVVIFEAAFKFKNLFVRTDILVKKGDKIQLIEVKAKSYNSQDEDMFLTKQGKILGSWKSYLFDVAFQNYVVKNAFLNWTIVPYLMMADKSKTAKIDGLNQLFRISQKADNRTGINCKVNSIADIKQTVLGRINIYDIVKGIFTGEHKYSRDFSFEEGIKAFAETYEKDDYFNEMVSYTACKNCEFKANKIEEDAGLKSGYKECWENQMQWTAEDFDKPTIFELWNFRKGNKLFEEARFFLEDLEKQDLNVKPEWGKISTSERQWVQLEKAVSKDDSIYLLKEELKEEMEKWTFPLNFIDFETSTAALPFTKGRRPYEAVAFQFSHHVVQENGEVTHETEYLNLAQGAFPNYDFVRALKTALTKNEGSIFMFSNHENTILNAIYVQLEYSQEEDKCDLQEFIKTITKYAGKSSEKWNGRRQMVDMLDVVKKYYYNPLTKGSNSIKAVLPAVMKSSKFLQEKYTQKLGDLKLSSKNYKADHVWFQLDKEEFQDPYKTLPALFADWTNEEIENTISGLEKLSDGGAALTAYGKLQYTDMKKAEQKELSNALLKYCELDTLAMVMIYEHFVELVD